MKILPILNKARASMLLLALVASIAGCSQEAAAPEAAESEASSSVTPASYAYVTSQKSDTAGVSVIDLSTMEVIKTFDLKAESPRGLGITDDGKKLIVATRENESIAVIDTDSGEVIQQIKVGKNPEFVRVKGTYAFISSEPSAVGGPPKRHEENEEEEEGEDDDDDALPAKIAIVDLEKGEKIREITGGPETEGIEFSNDGTKLIITNEADNTVTVHDIESGELIKRIETHEMGDRPRGIKVSPDGNTYLATLEWGNKFMVMDKDFNVVRTVDTGETPYGIAYNHTGDRIYVAAKKAKMLEVYDAKSYEKLNEVGIGDRCWHFTFTPDDQQILVSCGKSDAIYVIDANKFEVTKEIAIPDMPWGVVAYPKSMGSLDSK